MTDETNVETNGAGGQANPPASQGAVDGSAELLSKFAEIVDQRLDERLKPIKGEIGGLYSRQDKDRNAFREFMDEYKKQIGKGLSDTEAYNAAENALGEREKQQQKDKMIEEIYQKFVGSSSPQAPGTGASGAVDAAKVIAEYFDPRDPDVAPLLNRQYKSETEVREAVLGHLKSKRNAPSPSAAQSPAPQGGPPAPQDVDALTLEYKRKMLEARGQRSKGQLLKEEYRKKGVPVDTVTFSV